MYTSLNSRLYLIPLRSFLPPPPVSQVDDYWEPGKAMLQDPGKFLQSLFDYDKDNIPDPVIQKIQPYIDNPEFTPAAIEKVWLIALLLMVLTTCGDPILMIEG